MELSEIKDQLLKGVEVATKEKGYTLARGVWGYNSNKCACALGCYLAANDKDIHKPFPELKAMLGVDDAWLNDFVKGFDGLTMIPPQVKEARELGEWFAAQFTVPGFLELRMKAVEEEIKAEKEELKK